MTPDNRPFYIGKDSNGHFKHDHLCYYITTPLEPEKEEPPCAHHYKPYLETLLLFTDECPKCGKDLRNE